MLARRINNNVDRRGMLYTPLSDLEDFGDDVLPLIEQHNSLLFDNARHQARRLEVDRGHVYIRGYENDIVDIVEQIQSHTSSGVGGWENAVSQWIAERTNPIDDDSKSSALKSLFKESRGTAARIGDSS